MKLSFSRSVRGVFLIAAVAFQCVVALYAQTDEKSDSTLPYLKDKQRETGRWGGPATKQGEEAGEGIVDLSYSRVFRDTDNGVDLFHDTELPTYQGRFGQGGIRTQGNILSGRVSAPFLNASKFKPEDAELKLGNFYLDLRSVSASYLYSDNVDWSENNRRGDSLVALRTDFAVLFPLTEHFRISASGAFVYLPLQNRAGFAVFDPLKIFTYDPLFRVQVAYDMALAGWDVELSNDLRIMPLPYDFQISYSYFTGVFEDPERLSNHYSYGTTSADGGKVFEDRSPYGRYDIGIVQMRNRVGGHATRLLPTETRVDMGYYHSDFWYISGDTTGLVLPHAQEFAFATLRSERDNMRFKPFATYEATHYDYYGNDWQHSIFGGVTGPVTRNINFYGRAGERFMNIGNEMIWTVRLDHQIGPFTSHSFEYAQDVTEPDRAVNTEWAYRFHQIVGDGLALDLYGARGTFDEILSTAPDSDYWRAGAMLTYRVSPRTFAQLIGTYTRFDYQQINGADNQTWRLLALMHHYFTPTFEGRVQYQYTDRNSERRLDSYYENFTSISLIKYF